MKELKINLKNHMILEATKLTAIINKNGFKKIKIKQVFLNTTSKNDIKRIQQKSLNNH